MANPEFSASDLASNYADKYFRRDPADRKGVDFPGPCGNCKNLQVTNENVFKCRVRSGKAKMVIESGWPECNTQSPYDEHLKPESISHGLYGSSYDANNGTDPWLNFYKKFKSE